jgi:hypothetical protein
MASLGVAQNDIWTLRYCPAYHTIVGNMAARNEYLSIEAPYSWTISRDLQNGQILIWTMLSLTCAATCFVA